MRSLLPAIPILLSCTAFAARAECEVGDLLAELRRTEPSTIAAADRRLAATPNSEGLFFRVERRGTPPSYLFGTIHMSDRRVTVLSEPVRQAIGSARVVALELPPDSAADVAEATQRAMDLIRAGGRDLMRMVSPDDWLVISRAFHEAGIDPYRARFMPPVLMAVTLTISPCERRLRNAGRIILDHVIRDTARASDVEVVGLETAEEQITALTAQPTDDQLRMLIEAARARPFADLRADMSIRLWLERRPSYLRALAEISTSPTASADRTFMRTLFDQRNAVMRNRSLPLLREGNAFIAVGAGHLSGRNGLVELYRRAGYRVTRLD
jgi:uncharacterized protein YbaP (TraB family)